MTTKTLNEKLQLVLDALNNSSNIVFADTSKVDLRGIAIETVEELLKQADTGTVLGTQELQLVANLLGQYGLQALDVVQAFKANALTPVPASDLGQPILVKFHWDCGRMGKVEGLFVTTRALLASAYGKEAQLGEVLGKHSDVYGKLETKDFTIVTDHPATIAALQEVTGTTVSGINPLEFVDAAQ